MKLVQAIAFVLTLVSTSNAQRNLTDIPDSNPEVELKTFILPDGFTANLYASDPQLAKPIQMNFDAKGQLWVASSEVYPHIKPGQPATDKIIVLKDTTGDGKADHRRVFVDNLLIPTGVVPGDGGVYVANSTDLIHYSDTNGDGKSDTQRVILSGFGTEDTHHLLHTLRWGPDGALYMNQSIYIHSHVETPSGVKRLLGGGIWRFRPETMELEIFCRGFVNPWGHHFDPWGQSFATDGAYSEGINYVFPGAVFATAPNEPRRLKGLNPGSPKHCGLEILSGRHLPESWRGTMIANDFRGNRVCRFEVTENGSGFASSQVAEVIKSTHVAFRPIDVKMGPDGAIYIADWYNPIIQHGEVDFRDERRDHTHGRIWRITANDRPSLELPDFSGLSVNQLLDQLKAPEDWVRLYAKLELKTRPKEEVVKTISKWLTNLDNSHADYSKLQLEAMWAYQNVLHTSSNLVETLLNDDDHRVRAASVRLASVRRDKLPHHAEYFFTAATDEHPRVRLEAVRALAEVGTLEAVSQIANVLEDPMDRFLDFAIWRALRDNQDVWFPLVKQGEFTFDGKTSQLLFALNSIDNSNASATLINILSKQKEVRASAFDLSDAISANADPKALDYVMQWLLSNGIVADRDRTAASINVAISASLSNKVTPSNPRKWISTLKDAELFQQQFKAIAAWKFVDGYQSIYDTAQKDGKHRKSGITALGIIGGKQAIEVLSPLATHNDPDIRAAAINALSKFALERSAELAALDLASTHSIQGRTLPPILSQQSGIQLLIKAVAGKTLPTDNAKKAISTVRSTGNPSPELIAALRIAGKVDEAGWQLTQKLKESLLEEVRTSGDPYLGESIYRRKDLQCMKCHAIGGAGGKVGPDLISIGASAPTDYLIESLITPNSKIKENFHAIQVLDIDGQITSGIVIQSDDNALVLRTAKDELVKIQKSDIELQKETRSLMPDGTVDELTKEELVHLVSFLGQLGKVGDFQIGKEPFARTWSVLQFSNETHRVLNRTGIDSAAKSNEAFLWLPHYATVRGDVPTRELPVFKPHTQANPVSFLKASFEVTQAGQFNLNIENPAGVLIWVEGQPTAMRSGNASLTLDQGRYQIVLGVQHANRQQEAVRVLLTPSTKSRGQFQWLP